MALGVKSEACGVVGVHLDRAAVLALHQRGQVVHPRVVRAQLAAADQHHVAVAVLGKRGLEPRDVRDDRIRRKLDLARGRAQDIG
jgi:hypothetical protein